MSESRIPEDLRECYEACLAAEQAGCGEDCVDTKTEIVLIERIAKLEAQVAALSKPVTDEEIATASQNDWSTKRLSEGGFNRIIASRQGGKP